MIHIVVVSYRTPGDLDLFCQSVEACQPSGPWSMTIFNVSPQPGDIAVGERWAHALRARHLWDAENIGYGRACNASSRGVEWPPDERDDQGVLAFFNADVVLSEGALDQCVEALALNPDWGVLGPRQVNRRNQITGAGIFGTPDTPILRGWRQPAASGQFSDVRDDAVSVSGSAFFVRRSCWDHLRCCPVFKAIAPDAQGAFLPTPHYFEETWVSYHAKAHGWKVAYWGKTTITHAWHQASAIGGYAEQQFPVSEEMFRAACDRHGIPHN